MPRRRIEDDDLTIGEISSDDGTHIVYEVPTNKAKTVDRIMRAAGVDRDRDEELSKDARVARRMVESRDPRQLRYRQGRVTDETEDLEPEVDDDGILEPNEVSAE